MAIMKAIRFNESEWTAIEGELKEKGLDFSKFVKGLITNRNVIQSPGGVKAEVGGVVRKGKAIVGEGGRPVLHYPTDEEIKKAREDWNYISGVDPNRLKRKGGVRN